MNKEFKPKVSIIIPVYNGESFLEQAINSALHQTYDNIEVIVINDGSNDKGKTEAIAKKYNDKIKYFYKENGGVASALNMALEKMSGDYFSWLSHDDLYYDDKIEKQIKFIKQHHLQNEKVILFGDYSLIDENSKVFAECRKNHEEIENKPEYALLRGHLNGITVLIPKKAFEEYGKFDETLRCAQDYDMWKKMMKTYKVIHQPEILSKTRIHGKRDTAVNPKVITEGNKLWIDLIEDVLPQRKKELEGSEYNYYEEMVKFLKDTPYDEARKHCEDKVREIRSNIEEKASKTKVSVIIPFYNRQDLTLRALKSVQEQTHKNLEIIIVNDGSKDNIAKLKPKIREDKRIKYINLENNHGTGYARNTGIKNATGEYIAFLDSDDEFLKTKIEKQLKEVLMCDGIFSHTSYIRKDEKNNEKIINTGKKKGILYPEIIGGCAIATPTVMVKTEYLRENNFFYQDNSSLGEDICFYIEILENINVVGIEEPLSIVNVNSKSAAYDYQKQLEGLKNIIKFVLNSEKAQKYNFEIYRIFKEYINVYNCFMNQRDEMALLFQEIENYQNEIKQYTSQIEILNTEIKKLDEENHALKDELNSMQVYAAGIQKSISWRITAPLRKISAILRKIIKKIIKK